MKTKQRKTPDRDDQHEMSRYLMRHGFSPLGPDTVAQLAFMVQDHETLRKLIIKIEPEMRSQAYDALRPNLRFEPFPLDTYIVQTKEKAANARRDEIEVAAEEAINREASKIALQLTCAKCSTTESFPAFGSSDMYRDLALAKARRLGWTRSKFRDRKGVVHDIEICPNCPSRARLPFQKAGTA
jgi:hypothetical protein